MQFASSCAARCTFAPPAAGSCATLLTSESLHGSSSRVPSATMLPNALRADFRAPHTSNYTRFHGRSTRGAMAPQCIPTAIRTRKRTLVMLVDVPIESGKFEDTTIEHETPRIVDVDVIPQLAVVVLTHINVDQTGESICR